MRYLPQDVDKVDFSDPFVLLPVSYTHLKRDYKWREPAEGIAQQKPKRQKPERNIKQYDKKTQMFIFGQNRSFLSFAQTDLIITCILSLSIEFILCFFRLFAEQKVFLSAWRVA